MAQHIHANFIACRDKRSPPVFIEQGLQPRNLHSCSILSLQEQLQE